MVAQHNLLHASVLAAIDALKLSAHKVAQGALAGLHSSSQKGQSIEFAEHRIYTPGDDVKRIDWKAYAKTDRYHIKQFDDETHTHVVLVLDCSYSMAFKSGSFVSKWECAQTLAAALAYIALRQHDATGMAFAGNGTYQLTATTNKSSHLHTLLEKTVSCTPQGTTSLGACLEHVLETLHPRSTVCVFSDMFDTSGHALKALQKTSALKHSVHLLHTLDQAETTFPYETPAHFAASEDTRRLFIQPASVKKQYLKEFSAFVENLQKTLQKAGAHYHQALTSQDPAPVLRHMLRSTQKR